MISKLFGIIIGSAFIFGGVQIALDTAIPTYQSWQNMQSWQPASALLLDASYGSNQVKARYIYTIDGLEYENNRVSVSLFNDNIGDYQTEMATQLQHAKKNYHAIGIWYKPDEPSHSVIDKNMRWGLFSLISAFCSLFILIGLLIIFASIKTSNKKSSSRNRPSLSQFRQQWKQTQSNDQHQFEKQSPINQSNNSTQALQLWLNKKQWRKQPLRSDAKKNIWAIWLFAIFWTAISSPVLFVLPEELNKQNYAALIALLFPLVGLFLFYKAWKMTLEWRRFGVIELNLDPYPGSIGGHVGGVLLLKNKATFNAQFKIELQCIYSYISGNSNNRSRRKNIKWAEVGFAKKVLAANGLQLKFRFDVPDNLPEADVEQQGDYYFWQLKLSADLPGTDLNRSYNIPVFKTQKYSQTIRHDLSAQAVQLKSEKAQESQAAVSLGDFSSTSLNRALRYKNKGSRHIFYFPMFRNKLLTFISLIFGAGFGFAAYSINHDFADGSIMSIVMLIFSLPFALVGFVGTIAFIYLPLNNLSVTVADRKIKAIRRLFIFPIKYNVLNNQDIKQIEIKRSGSTGEGTEQITHYKLIVHSKSSKKFTIAEDIDGEELAAQLKSFICKRLFINC